MSMHFITYTFTVNRIDTGIDKRRSVALQRTKFQKVDITSWAYNQCTDCCVITDLYTQGAWASDHATTAIPCASIQLTTCSNSLYVLVQPDCNICQLLLCA